MNRSLAFSLFALLLFTILAPVVLAAPGGTIVSPTNGAFVSAPMTTFTINETLVQAAVTWTCIDTEIVQYPSAGTYTVTHTGLLVDGESCIITLSGFGPTGSLTPLPGGIVQITVTADTAAPLVNAGPDITTNRTFTRTATATDRSPLGYSWGSAGPGSITFSNDRSLTTDITAAVDGVYTIFFTVSDAVGNTVTDSFILTWNSTFVPPPDMTPPVVNAGPDFMTNATFSRTGIVTDASAFTTLWTATGPGVITFSASNALTSTIAASADGVYTITLTATDAAGNVGSDSFLLTWNTTTIPPSDITPPFVNAGPDFMTNASFSRTGIVTDASAFTTLWTATGPGAMLFTASTALTTSIFTTIDGVYTITLTATDAAGNVGSDSFLLTWNTTTIPPPVPLNFAFTFPWVSTNGTDLITFTTTAASVSCSFDNATWTTCTSAITTPAALTGWSVLPEGPVSLFALATDGVGNFTSASRIIIKNTLNNTNLTNVAPVAAITAPSSVVRNTLFTADASGSNDVNIGGPLNDSLTYTFNFGDGTVLSGVAATRTHSYSAAGTYTITLIVTDRFGLNATATRTISVTNPSSSSGGGSSRRSGGGGGIIVNRQATNATNGTSGTSIGISTSGSSGSSSSSSGSGSSSGSSGSSNQGTAGQTTGQGTNTASGSNNEVSGLTGAIIDEDGGAGVSFAVKTIGYSLLGIALLFLVALGVAYSIRPKP